MGQSVVKSKRYGKESVMFVFFNALIKILGATNTIILVTEIMSFAINQFTDLELPKAIKFVLI